MKKIFTLNNVLTKIISVMIASIIVGFICNNGSYAFGFFVVSIANVIGFFFFYGEEIK